MREAARALDDVSDHLGEVLRRADELLAEWSQFGAQVRSQVEREVGAIGGVVDDAVARAAGAGIDRAVADRLRALTSELERLEQRARAVSRAVVEQREADRRVLWVLVAGVVLANALLVVLLLRRPDPVPVAEPIRIDSPAVQPQPTGAAPAAGSAEAENGVGASGAGGSAADGQGRPTPPGPAPGAAPNAGSNAASAGSNAAGAGSNAAGAGSNAAAGSNSAAGANTPGGPGKTPSPRGAAKAPPEPSGARPAASPIALPPRGTTHHKKMP